MLSNASNRGTKSLCGACFRTNRWTKLLVLFMVVFVSLETRLRNSRQDLLLREGSTKTTKRLWRVRTDDLRSSGISSTTNTTAMASQEETKQPNKEQSNNNRGGDEFDQVLWPQLQERLCPGGVPDTSLGASLFELGRVEFGLDANATAAKQPRGIQKNRQNTIGFFYDGGFGFTLYLDAADPTNTVFYAPIWKCANDQIHSYLHRVFNRRKDGTVRNPSERMGHANDTYLENLNHHDLEFLFHEILEKKKKQSTTTTTITENDASYSTFNQSARSKPCVFTVLRDPISHFLSGYNEIEYRFIHGDKDAPVLPRDSNKVGSYFQIPYLGTPEKRQERFTHLVKNLLKEHPSFSQFFYYRHFAPMSRILPTLARFDLLPTPKEYGDEGDESDSSSKRNAQWFLPTLENLTETFPRFLAERCPTMARNYQHQLEPLASSNSTTEDALHPFPPMKRMGKHESSHDPYGTYQAAKDVWKQGGPVARALCVLHSMDYACFPGLVIPPVCRDVYASQAFVKRMLPASPTPST